MNCLRERGRMDEGEVGVGVGGGALGSAFYLAVK